MEVHKAHEGIRIKRTSGFPSRFIKGIVLPHLHARLMNMPGYDKSQLGGRTSTLISKIGSL